MAPFSVIKNTCLKFTIMTLGQHSGRDSGVFVVDFEPEFIFRAGIRSIWLLKIKLKLLRPLHVLTEIFEIV